SSVGRAKRSLLNRSRLSTHWLFVWALIIQFLLDFHERLARSERLALERGMVKPVARGSEERITRLRLCLGQGLKGVGELPNRLLFGSHFKNDPGRAGVDQSVAVWKALGA